MLDLKEISEFQEIFKKEYGYQISIKEAEEYAAKLIDLVRTVYES